MALMERERMFELVQAKLRAGGRALWLGPGAPDALEGDVVRMAGEQPWQPQDYLSAVPAACFDAVILDGSVGRMEWVVGLARRALRWHGVLLRNLDGWRLYHKRPGWLLLSSPRCGTHMVYRALNQHSALRCLGEAFCPTHEAGRHMLTDVQAVLELAWPTPDHGVAAHAYIGMVSGPFRAHPVFTDLWERLPRKLRVVRLQRRNLLARHVSHLAARQSGRFEGGSPPAVSVRERELLQDITATREAWRRAAARFPDSIVVHYEDLLTDWGAEMARIQTHLDAAAEDLPQVTEKTGGALLRDRVENFVELRHRLRDKVPPEWFDE